MEDIFTFQLDAEAYEKALSGKKNVQLEINNKNKKNFAVGNKITFVCKTEEKQRQVNATIENLLYFNTIMEAVETLGKESCGFKPNSTFDKASDAFLSGESYESIEKFGIVAIIFKIID